MKRIFLLFALISFISLPFDAQTATKTSSSASHSPLIELPQRFEWLKDKRLFCSNGSRYLIAAKDASTAEKVMASTATSDQRIGKYFKGKKTGTKPVLILIMENKKEFAQYSARKEFQGLSISFLFNSHETQVIIIMRSKEGIYDILPHEIAHLAVLDISKTHGNNKGDTYPPLCFNEGIAEYFVSATQKVELKKLCYYTLSKHKLISLQKLLQTKRYASDMLSLATFYSASYSLVDYIQTLPGGKEKLIKYIELFDGRRENPYELFKEVFCSNVSSVKFEKGWINYITNKYVARDNTAIACAVKSKNRKLQASVHKSKIAVRPSTRNLRSTI